MLQAGGIKCNAKGRNCIGLRQILTVGYMNLSNKNDLKVSTDRQRTRDRQTSVTQSSEQGRVA